MKTQSSAKFSSTRRDKALKLSTSSVPWRVPTSRIPRSTSSSGGKGKCFSAAGTLIVQVLITQTKTEARQLLCCHKAGLQLCSDLPQGHPGGRHQVLGRKPHKPISVPSHHTQEQHSRPRNTSTGNFALGIRSQLLPLCQQFANSLKWNSHKESFFYSFYSVGRPTRRTRTSRSSPTRGGRWTLWG